MVVRNPFVNAHSVFQERDGGYSPMGKVHWWTTTALLKCHVQHSGIRAWV